MIPELFSIAFKNLRHRGIRSWLTLLGIFIGVTAVVSLISLGTGLKTAVNAQFGISNTKVITVEAGGISGMGPPGSMATNPLTVADVHAIQKLGVVRRAIRRNILSSKIEYNNQMAIGITVNLPSGEDRKFVYDAFELEPKFGRLLKDSDHNVVMVGYNFYANKMGFGKEIKPGKRIMIQGKKFKVVGIVKKKGSFMFDNAIYMNEGDAEDLWDYGDNVDLIAVEVKEKGLVKKASEEISKLLRKRRNVKKGQEDFKVSTPEAILSKVNSILTGVQIFILIIASISIIVGALGIINTMTTSVVERKKEIGIMKAIGATNFQIFNQFFIESGLLGFVGGLIGVFVGSLIGFIGTLAINKFVGAETSPQLNIPLIILTLFGSFLIGAIAGIIPAMRAAKQNPVEALRG